MNTEDQIQEMLSLGLRLKVHYSKLPQYLEKYEPGGSRTEWALVGALGVAAVKAINDLVEEKMQEQGGKHRSKRRGSDLMDLEEGIGVDDESPTSDRSRAAMDTDDEGVHQDRAPSPELPQKLAELSSIVEQMTSAISANGEINWIPYLKVIRRFIGPTFSAPLLVENSPKVAKLAKDILNIHVALAYDTPTEPSLLSAKVKRYLKESGYEKSLFRKLVEHYGYNYQGGSDM